MRSESERSLYSGKASRSTHSSILLAQRRLPAGGASSASREPLKRDARRRLGSLLRSFGIRAPSSSVGGSRPLGPLARHGGARRPPSAAERFKKKRGSFVVLSANDKTRMTSRSRPGSLASSGGLHFKRSSIVRYPKFAWMRNWTNNRNERSPSERAAITQRTRRMFRRMTRVRWVESSGANFIAAWNSNRAAPAVKSRFEYLVRDCYQDSSDARNGRDKQHLGPRLRWQERHRKATELCDDFRGNLAY